MRASALFSVAAAASGAIACDSCYGPSTEVVHERLVRRMQPEASDATLDPKAPLEWGQLNFLHTVSQFSYFRRYSISTLTFIDRYSWLA
jgi:hypothetical protein